MTRIITIIAMATMVSAPALAAPTAKGQWELGAAAGMAYPNGHTSSLESAWQFGAAVGYYVSPVFAITGDVYYAQHDAKPSEPELLKSEIVQVGLRAKYLIVAASLAPYLKAGPNYYRFTSTDEATAFSPETEDQNSWAGFGGGLGLQYRTAGRVGFFVEGEYNVWPTIDSSDEWGSFLSWRGGIQLTF